MTQNITCQVLRFFGFQSVLSSPHSVLDQPPTPTFWHFENAQGWCCEQAPGIARQCTLQSKCKWQSIIIITIIIIIILSVETWYSAFGLGNWTFSLSSWGKLQVAYVWFEWHFMFSCHLYHELSALCQKMVDGNFEYRLQYLFNTI